MRPLLALAAIYSRGTCRPTTIDVLMFHFRVRNGTGWGHQAVTTRFRRAAVCVAPRAWLSVAGLGGVRCAVSGWGGLASAWQRDLQFTIYNLQFLNQVLKAATRGGVEVYWMLVALG